MTYNYREGDRVKFSCPGNDGILEGEVVGIGMVHIFGIGATYIVKLSSPIDGYKYSCILVQECSMKTVELRPRLYKVKPGSMTLSRYVGMIVEGHIDLEYGCVKVDCIDPETGESISAMVSANNLEEVCV